MRGVRMLSTPANTKASKSTPMPPNPQDQQLRPCDGGQDLPVIVLRESSIRIDEVTDNLGSIGATQERLPASGGFPQNDHPRQEIDQREPNPRREGASPIVIDELGNPVRYDHRCAALHSPPAEQRQRSCYQDKACQIADHFEGFGLGFGFEVFWSFGGSCPPPDRLAMSLSFLRFDHHAAMAAPALKVPGVPAVVQFQFGVPAAAMAELTTISPTAAVPVPGAAVP